MGSAGEQNSKTCPWEEEVAGEEDQLVLGSIKVECPFESGGAAPAHVFHFLV